MTLQDIMQRFEAGERLVSFKTARPQQVRKNIEKQARRRGLLWRFATLEDEVFVTR